MTSPCLDVHVRFIGYAIDSSRNSAARCRQGRHRPAFRWKAAIALCLLAAGIRGFLIASTLVLGSLTVFVEILQLEIANMNGLGSASSWVHFHCTSVYLDPRSLVQNGVLLP